MTSIFSCPFCGLKLGFEYHQEEWTQPRITRIRPWSAELRGIYLPNANSSVFITGLGIQTGWHDLSAPLRSDLSYLDVKKENLREWSFGRWCFGFHESCWKLLLLRFGLDPKNRFQNEAKKAIAESVYYYLHCTPWPEVSSFAFDHDWPGAAQVNELSKYDNPLTPFYVDPWNIPHEDELEAVATVSEICSGLQRMRLEGACPPTTSSTAIDHPNFQGIVASGSVQSSETPEKESSTKPPEANHYLFGPLSPELGLEILSYFSF